MSRPHFSDTIIIRNLNPSATVKDIQGLFSSKWISTIADVKLVSMHRLCYVRFSSSQSASQAVRECKSSPSFGRELQVSFAKPHAGSSTLERSNKSKENNHNTQPDAPSFAAMSRKAFAAAFQSSSGTSSSASTTSSSLTSANNNRGILAAPYGSEPGWRSAFTMPTPGQMTAFVPDPAGSAYLFDASTLMYYDPEKKCFWDAMYGVYYFLDGETQIFYPYSPPSAKEAETALPASAATAAINGAPSQVGTVRSASLPMAGGTATSSLPAEEIKKSPPPPTEIVPEPSLIAAEGSLVRSSLLIYKKQDAEKTTTRAIAFDDDDDDDGDENENGRRAEHAQQDDKDPIQSTQLQRKDQSDSVKARSQQLQQHSLRAARHSAHQKRQPPTVVYSSMQNAKVPKTPVAPKIVAGQAGLVSVAGEGLPLAEIPLPPLSPANWLQVIGDGRDGVCRLCKRKMQSFELWRRHCLESALHLHRMQGLGYAATEPPADLQFYRDRAQERRVTVGSVRDTVDPLQPGTHPAHAVEEPNPNPNPNPTPAATPISSSVVRNSVGAKLLGKLGWKEGEALGSGRGTGTEATGSHPLERLVAGFGDVSARVGLGNARGEQFPVALRILPSDDLATINRKKGLQRYFLESASEASASKTP
jgi:hypothetical protein